MNLFTQRSIELANQRNYLDQLFSVYPLSPDSIREIDQNLWGKIESAFHDNDNIRLFNTLLELDLFPIKDGYVPYFKRDKSAVNRNPNTVNRICGRIHELGIDKIYERCTQPKETNRQMGPLFRRWVKSGAIGLSPVDEFTFLNKISKQENTILDGSDSLLKDFATRNLGYSRTDKGIDLIAWFNGKFIIGEAKFISDEGGHQNDQFLDAMTTINTPTANNVINIAILDGVLYIPSKKKMYSYITGHDLPIMSALLLRDFLFQL